LPTRPAPSWLLLLAATGVATPLAAQTPATTNYPTRPVRMIVPVAPGGSTDVVGRIVGARLSEVLGQPVVVDNRPGASGVIGSDLVAKASPDGYTLLFAYASHTSVHALYSKLPFDPVNDFTPISQVSTTPLVLVVHPSITADSIKDLVAASRAKPGGFFAGIPTAGSAGHLATELFKSLTGASVTSVIYRGGGPAQVALMSGEVQMVFASTGAALPHIKGGRVKVVGAASKRRLPYLPDVPTLAESGLKDFAVTPWQGVLGPARLPQTIVDRLNGEIVKMLKAKDVVDRISATGSDPVGSSPQEFAQEIRREIELFGRIIRTSGIKGE
jgi:tripartite-type tricarboxylate transporter receptor subunit TctC